MPNDIRNAFLRLSTVGKAQFLARLVHTQTVHARDAYSVDYDKPDGIQLREHNETVHRLSGILMAVLGEKVSNDHHEYMVKMIELIASSAPSRRAELERWLANAAAGDFSER